MAPVQSDRNKKPYSRPRRSDGFWLHDPVSSTKPRNATDLPSPAAPNTKLIVSNLHYEITPKDLVSIFGQVGTLVREPHIRYDRSGRSSGVAIISYENAEDASRAKKQFEGKLAKGQPMEIAIDTTPPKRPRSASLPLLNRLERRSLADRLGNGEQAAERTELGPIRRRPTRPIRGGPRGSRSTRPKPKTAEELDRELDVFMGEDVEETTNAESKAGELAQAQDVEMA
ncbi:hypothetical protein SCLCIDRAFT_1206689 [Scleroderma citrinum Foug A]|uniref:RRM domain-containing protein n=1 Tax=Scleroderma citrinum Foug A TaxID=1036808 RepID=A0A0C3AZZ2_9AGAM|nr:hypothetical protein SCLCIDRAFT_1206689 [Scleroderma citrinum Foug A]